ncbi:hypothetical protein [Stieleria varia]|uniref:Uncharacterized protein n=1 Tax=Stieleria varia TaxID=2528005 RepID=A0A5C6AP82_9BACT|nr:hypothetical protein [Stieleria varia]TWU01231.1 hypothetical protein Pla52n_46040 [Stieleria varia]
MSDLKQMRLFVAIGIAVCCGVLASARSVDAQSMTSPSTTPSCPQGMTAWPIAASTLPTRPISSQHAATLSSKSADWGDAAEIPIPELRSTAQSKASAPDKVVQMKPQNGFSMPGSIQTAGGAAAAGANNPNPYRTETSGQNTPAFTGLSDQRATPRPQGPTTAEVEERDNRWRTNVTGAQMPTTDRIAQRDTQSALQQSGAQQLTAAERFAQAAAANAASANSGQANDPSIAAASAQAGNRNINFPPLPGSNNPNNPAATNPNFATLPGGLGLPNQNAQADRTNTRSVGFNPNDPTQTTNDPAAINLSIAERNERLRLQNLATQQAERERLAALATSGQTSAQQQAAGQTPEQVAYQQRLAEYRQQQAMLDYQKRLAAAGTPSATNATTGAGTSWDMELFNTQNQTGNPAQSGIQNVGLQNPALQNPGAPNNPQSNPYQTASDPSRLGFPNTTAAAPPAQRDVDPSLSEADKQRLPANAWTFDDWGLPVDKGGRVLDRRGNPVSKEEQFRLRYGSVAGNMGNQPNGAAPGQVSPGQGTLVSNRASTEQEDRTASFSDGDRTNGNIGGTTKPRGFVAQSFFNGAMLVSIVANVYMIYWFKNVYVRYRELIAAQRVMNSPGSLID